jgi:hypothetical protein
MNTTRIGFLVAVLATVGCGEKAPVDPGPELSGTYDLTLTRLGGDCAEAAHFPAVLPQGTSEILPGVIGCMNMGDRRPGTLTNDIDWVMPCGDVQPKTTTWTGSIVLAKDGASAVGQIRLVNSDPTYACESLYDAVFTRQ